MAATYSDLVKQSRDSATADSSWLGSEEHRVLLDISLEPVFAVTNVTLQWAPSGSPGFWEPACRLLTLERPIAHRAASPEDIAEFTALGLLHESLHVRHSTTLGIYPRKRNELALQLKRAAERLFNLLEDYRITACGLEEDSELAAPLARFIDESVRQISVDYENRQHEDADTTEPSSQRNQLFFALQTYALRPDRELTLHPNVDRELAVLLPIMDRARNGSTEDCGLAAVLVVKELMQDPLPS